MKNIAICTIALICLSGSVKAEDNYYYYCGSKITLDKVPTKVVTISTHSSEAISSESVNTDLDGFYCGQDLIVKIHDIGTTMEKRDSYHTPTSSSVCTVPCYSSESVGELVPNGYLNVKLKTESDFDLLAKEAGNRGCKIIGQNKFMPLWYSLSIIPSADKNPVEIANSLYETGLFSASCPSFSFYALQYSISYDPNIKEQSNLCDRIYGGYDISVSGAWNYATGWGINIAIIDTGIDLTHIDLVDNLHRLSYDTEESSSPSKTYSDHGTHCAGIAAAVRNNNLQISGVAPDARLMSISSRLFEPTDSSESVECERKLADGINWAWMNGADVISCSWRSIPNEMITEAIKNAVTKGRKGKGCVYVNAAGNEELLVPINQICYPANLGPDVIAVANMTQTGEISEDSCYGSNMFIAAPGTKILSTIRENKLKRETGTSMACPHVAGVAALILERNPDLTPEQVREIMGRTARKVGNLPYDAEKEYGTWNEHFGYGLLNAEEAVKNTPLY